MLRTFGIKPPGLKGKFSKGEGENCSPLPPHSLQNRSKLGFPAFSPLPLGWIGTDSNAANRQRREGHQHLKLTVYLGRWSLSPTQTCIQSQQLFIPMNSSLSTFPAQFCPSQGLVHSGRFFLQIANCPDFLSCLDFYNKPHSTSYLTGSFASYYDLHITCIIRSSQYSCSFLISSSTGLTIGSSITSCLMPLHDLGDVITPHLAVKSARSQLHEPLSSHLLSLVSSYSLTSPITCPAFQLPGHVRDIQ